MVVLLTQNTRYTKISNIKIFEVIIMKIYPWKDKIYFAIITLNIKLCAKIIFGYTRKTTSFLGCKNSLVYSNIRAHSLWWKIEKMLTAVNSHSFWIHIIITLSKTFHSSNKLKDSLPHASPVSPVNFRRTHYFILKFLYQLIPS